MGKVVIDSLVIEEATDAEMTGLAYQMSRILDGDKGRWMLIETDSAHNAIWVHPTSEVRLEFDEHPLLGELLPPEE